MENNIEIKLYVDVADLRSKNKWYRFEQLDDEAKIEACDGIVAIVVAKCLGIDVHHEVEEMAKYDNIEPGDIWMFKTLIKYAYFRSNGKFIAFMYPKKIIKEALEILKDKYYR